MTESSPLAEANPDSLTALFGDPMEKPEAEITALVDELRRRRSVFASEEAVRAMKDKPKRAKVGTDPASPQVLDKPSSEISLGDL